VKSARAVKKAGARVREHRLKNGLRILLAERHSDPVVSVVLFYKVGAVNEGEREAGVSHFLEHMMFKGSRRFAKGEVDRLTTSLGGRNNAFTGNDHTAYWFEFASDRWEAALDIEADRMCGLRLTPSEFESEKAVVLEELSMGEDDPWRSLARRVEAALFGRHPYGRPIIGYADVLHHLTAKAMRAYYDRFYHPSNATLVVCGDIHPERALRAIRKRFARVPARPRRAAQAVPRPAPEEPAGPQHLSMTWDDGASRLAMAWAGAQLGTRDDYALDLICCILTSGRMSRLQRRLVHDQPFATSISSSNDARVEGGAFWLFAECAQGVAPATVEAEVLSELEDLASRAPRAAEVRRAKRLMHASEAFDSETVTEIAEELGEYATDADWRLAFDGCARHDAITPAEIRECATRLLAPARRVVGTSLPRNGNANGRANGKGKKAPR